MRRSNWIREWHLFALFGSIMILAPKEANGWGTGSLHKLGVYRISYYGTTGAYRILNHGECSAKQSSVYWKPSLQMNSYPEQDPYVELWKSMGTNCSGYGCANTQSMRYMDQQVTHSTIVGGQDSWQNYNMVFFFGHNNTISNNNGPSYFIRRYNYCTEDGGWAHRWYVNKSGSPARWGTTDQVGGYDYAYCYHRDGWITNTDIQPGGVVYLYNAFTSLLIGRNDFRTNTSSVEYKSTWNGQVKNYNPEGGLGRNKNDNLKWLILHGCHGVVVENQNGQYDPQGIQVFGNAWNKLHIVLGHNTDVYLGATGDLSAFSNWLITGVPVRTAYFYMDYYNSGSQQASAISGEDESSRTCGYENINRIPVWVCAISPDETTMHKDDWLSPEPNKTPTWWYTQHVVDIT